MHRSSVSTFFRCTALVCAVAWFVASNHCALASVIDGLTKRDASAGAQCEHCPSKKESSGNTGAPMSGCCKGIKAMAPKSANTGLAPVFGNSIVTVVLPFVQTPRTAHTAAVDTGPPRAASFAEAILSRSFQSHAPPLIG